MQYLSMMGKKEIWDSFGSWLRTIRPEVLPSEKVVASSMRNSIGEFSSGYAMQYLLMTEFERAKTDLIGLLNDSDPHVVNAARKTLEAIHKKEAADALGF